MDILEYLNKLDQKVEKKQLGCFWAVVDREDFKPIKNLSDEELNDKIDKRLKYYAGKRLADVKIYVKNRKECVKNNDSLVHLVYGIWKISNIGTIKETPYSLLVLFYKDDLKKTKITLKLVQRFMQLCADGILGSSVIGGIKFSKLIKKLEDKKIVF